MIDLEEKIRPLEKKVNRKALQAVLKLQLQRFHHDYAFYFNHEEGHQAVTFFFEKVYNLQFRESGRDLLARNTFNRVKDRLKESTRRKIGSLLQLHDLTYLLDLRLALEFEKTFSLSETLRVDDYYRLYAACDNRDERMEQLELLLYVFEIYFEFSRRPTFKMVMAPLRIMARFFSANSLVGIVDEGYEASLSISPGLFAEFLESIRENETRLIEQYLPVSGKNSLRS